MTVISGWDAVAHCLDMQDGRAMKTPSVPRSSQIQPKKNPPCDRERGHTAKLKSHPLSDQFVCFVKKGRVHKSGSDATKGTRAPPGAESGSAPPGAPATQINGLICIHKNTARRDRTRNCLFSANTVVRMDLVSGHEEKRNLLL